MTIRSYLGKTIPARCFRAAAALLVLALAAYGAAAPAKKKSAPAKPAARNASAPAAQGALAQLTRAYREDPSPARRAALERYAATHAGDANGPMARLAMGIAAYEHKDFATAIAALKLARVPRAADYAAYYLAAARVEAKEESAVAGRDLTAAHAGEIASPLSGKAWLVEARALKASDPPAAVRLLRERYADLPQPEGDLVLADCYQAAADLPHAADFYQRVYVEYPTGEPGARAATALLALKDAMGGAYPPPLPQQLLRRAERLMELRQYSQARAEYQAAVEQTAGVYRDRARVGVGAAQFMGGDTGAAYPYLRRLDLPESEADAERLYYLAECARRQTDDDEMLSAVKRLGERYSKSPWRLKALISAANRFLLVNRPDAYVPLYKAAYESFPGDPTSGTSHWKVTFQAWMRNQADAADLLREQLRNYPSHPTAGASLYFLGRWAEQANDFSAARAYYQRLAKAFQNTYYAMLARSRTMRAEIAGAAPSEQAAAFLAGLALPEAKPVPTESARATTLRVERSRLLRTAGLSDLADTELRFGARTGGQPALLAVEAAGAAEAPHSAMRLMKSMSPDYLNLPLEAAPRKYWEFLFPLPYRGDLFRNAGERRLDPFLVAGLIRQESEFNPQAVSRANAYGLTQVRPGTGRMYARQAGVSRFTSRMLFQPAANLKIGATVLRSMLDANDGRLEATLASYNAGPNRAAEWLAWNTYREPAEFVESIPFTETRDYVQAVLRNADIYRRLYGK
jgi:soluble lytic murein transglycosylase